MAACGGRRAGGDRARGCGDLGLTGARDVAGNEIGKEGAQAIGKALETNRSLTSLDLAREYPGRHGRDTFGGWVRACAHAHAPSCARVTKPVSINNNTPPKS